MTMKTTIQSTAGYRLDVSLERGAYGTVLKFISFVPHASKPEERTQFQVLLSDAEIKVLSEAVAAATI